jgi:hypothetical protein
MPRGFICADIGVAAQIAKSGFFAPSGIVVKANDGVGGYGTLLYSPDRFHHGFDIEEHLQMSARLMPIFSKGTVVVEAYVESQAGSEISSPSIQGAIDPSGKVNIDCLAAQMVGRGGRYVGALIAPDIFPVSVAESLRSIGRAVGEIAAILGYRGYFNIDTVLDRDGAVYCVELNARRTSVRYVLDLASHLCGPEFARSLAIISSERFSSTKLLNHSYSSIRSLLSGLLFPLGAKRQGLILTIVGSLAHYTRAPQLGFIVLGEDITTARSIHAEATALLRGNSWVGY